MSKRYKILQKKLQELEAKLSHVFSVSAETQNLNLNLSPERIQQRFEFLKNLLSAEIASCRPSKSRHLRHIGKRLTELEIAFRDRNLNEYHSHVDENIINYNLDTPSSSLSSSPSVCSCDVSSPEDEASSGLGDCSEEDHDSPRALVKVKVQKNEDFISSSDEEVEVQKKDIPRPVKAEVGNQEVSVEKKEEGRISALWKYCGALIGGTILGMILMGAAVAIVGDCASSSSPPPLREGFTFYT